jgi:predicted DNA-binding protein
LGDPPQPHVIKFSTSLPPDIYQRLERYCADEERDKAWCLKKAIEKWLTEKGY